MQDFLKTLERCFEQPLPSQQAHNDMLADINFPKNKQKSEASQSSVLILFYPRNNNIYTVFIERPLYDGIHSGQIAFPGGKMENSDNTLIDTALRETKEEIGINQNKIKISGSLSQVYVIPSNFLITPFVGIYEDEPVFKPDAREVSRLIEVPFDELLNKKNISKGQVKAANGRSYNVPCFKLKNNIIWGATAMILNEFIYLWDSSN